MHDHAMRADDFPAGFEVERIAEAGHFLHQEEPEEVNRLLLGWLKRNTMLGASENDVAAYLLTQKLEAMRQSKYRDSDLPPDKPPIE